MSVLTERLNENHNLSVKAISGFYWSLPLAGGPTDQPAFINAVIIAKTALTPNNTLLHLQQIEHECGKQKRCYWGPRCIDIDLLLYDALTINEKHLTLPHKALLNRWFCLYPLYELAPNFVLPKKKHIQDALGEAPRLKLKREGAKSTYV